MPTCPTELVQDEVGLLKVEDDVQLTHLHGQTHVNGVSRSSEDPSPVTFNPSCVTYAAKVFIQQLYEAVDDFQGDELVVLLFYCATEVQAGVPTILRSLHSRKLHIFGFRASTICMSSLTIFFLSRSAVAVYHFCSRSFPCRLKSSMKRICTGTRPEERERTEAIRASQTCLRVEDE
ncbi:hypothetical protein EYF80_048444 [Liparis tanakae]|uniref:Uncharacterized protein n=1 Tax=Liparis tanakae TaxID=230148 RepID=A0A4Z2FJL0_9TELE|nr:hypothetical protein EYF80_048444 [Liparis tanakae]